MICLLISFEFDRTRSNQMKFDSVRIPPLDTRNFTPRSKHDDEPVLNESIKKEPP